MQWAPEMIFLSCAIVAGILLFSSVTSEIFAYKELEKIESIAMKKKRNMEEFLYEIQSIKENVFFPDDVHENAIDAIKDQTRFSTNIYFGENKYFQELSQALKYRVVKDVLWRHRRTFKFFLRDWFYNFKAADGLIMQMLTNLRCRDYDSPGNIIIDDNKPVREFVIVAKGCCNLVGKFTDSEGN